MLRRKVKGVMSLAVLVFSLSATTVLATDTAPPLNDLLGNQTTQTQQIVNSSNVSQSESTGKRQNSKDNGYGALADAASIDLNNPQLDNAKSGMQKIASIIITFLSYLIVLGMTVVTLCDLTYIALPPIRKVLNPEYNPNGGPTAGIGTGPMNNMVGSGMGMHMGMGMNMGMSLGSPISSMGPQQTQPQGIMRHQFISNAAINAVNMASVVDPLTGKTHNPFKVYSKDMMLLLIFTPILIVLATNGILVDVGFALGSLIGTVLQSIFGNIL